MIRIPALTAAICLTALPAAAAPFCHMPQDGRIALQIGSGIRSESEKAAFYELRLRQRGIDARDTRMWNECIQTFVLENGRISMRFYDPFTLDEIPVD